MSDLITALRSGKVLLMDGAMGTELQRLTQMSPFAGGEVFNLTNPDVVRRIHRAYVDAGAKVLLTNTFQANPSALARQHLGDQLGDIWDSAIQFTREAAAGNAFVLADIGPVEGLTDDIARRMGDACHQTDGMLLETWSSIDALQQFTQAQTAAIPVLVSFTFQRANAAHELTTFANVGPEACARSALACGVVALGANCGKEIGMEDLAELVQRFRAVCELPIFVRPNAGTPIYAGTTWRYPRSAAQMAQALPSLLTAGVSMVGGCCGTTPEHIRAFGDVIDIWRSARPEPAPSKGGGPICGN